MGVVDRMRMGENIANSTKEPKGSHAIARNDGTEQEADIGVAWDYPDEPTKVGPRVSMS